MRKPIGLTYPVQLETPEEREIFSAMEQSSVRKEGIRDLKEKPNITKIMEELAWARVVIRELSDRLSKLEAKQ